MAMIVEMSSVFVPEATVIGLLQFVYWVPRSA